MLTLLIPMSLFCVGYPILYSTVAPLAMRETPDKANGAAVLSFIGVSMSVIMTFLLSILHVAQAWIMPVIFFIALGCMALIYYLIYLSKPTRDVEYETPVI